APRFQEQRLRVEGRPELIVRQVTDQRGAPERHERLDRREDPLGLVGPAARLTASWWKRRAAFRSRIASWRRAVWAGPPPARMRGAIASDPSDRLGGAWETGGCKVMPHHPRSRTRPRRFVLGCDRAGRRRPRRHAGGSAAGAWPGPPGQAAVDPAATGLRAS